MLTAKSFGSAEEIEPFYLDFEPPSPKDPSRPLRVSLERRNRFFGESFFAGDPLDEADELAGEDDGEQGIENAPEGNIG